MLALAQNHSSAPADQANNKTETTVIAEESMQSEDIVPIEGLKSHRSKEEEHKMADGPPGHTNDY